MRCPEQIGRVLHDEEPEAEPVHPTLIVSLRGPEDRRQRLSAYADDLVILCRRGNAEAALHHLREITGKLKLTVNEDKTRICAVPEGEFDFLGFTFGQELRSSH